MPEFIADRYQIIRFIGAGSSGRVFLCKDTDSSNLVAVKILHPFTSNDESLKKQFEEEAKRTAVLNHDNIVSILDYSIDDNTPFLVMEYLPTTLKEILDKNHVLNYQEVLKISISLCEALKYAHQLPGTPLVHRDIKPANIMFSDENITKLCDFGIARTEESTTQTIGASYPYASHQQLEGDLDPINDIYSIGIVMYEMLTGTTPFKLDSRSTIEWHTTHSSQPVPDFNPELNIPVEVQHVVLRCLKKDKDQRYQNANELIEHITNIYKQIEDHEFETIKDTRVVLDNKSKKHHQLFSTLLFYKRNKLVTIALMGFLTIGVLGIFFTFQNSSNTKQSLSNAETNVTTPVNATGNTITVDPTQGLNSITDTSPTSTSASLPKTVSTPENLYSNIQNPKKRENSENLVHKGNVEYEAFNYDNAIDLYTEAINEDPTYPEGYIYRAIVYNGIGENDKALNDINIGISLYPNNPQSYSVRAIIFRELKQYKNSLDDFDKAITITPNDSNLLAGRGLTYFSMDDFDKAKEDFTSAITMNPNSYQGYLSRGLVFGLETLHEEAIDDYAQAIRIKPNEPAPYYSRAVAYTQIDEYDLAIDDYTSAINKNYSPIKDAYDRRGAIRAIKGDLIGGIQDLTKAIENEPKDASLYATRGMMHGFNSNFQKGIADFNIAITLQPESSDYYLIRGNLHKQIDQYDEALLDYDKSIELNPANQNAIDRKNELQSEIVISDQSITDKFSEGLMNVGEGSYEAAIDNLTFVIENSSKENDRRLAFMGRGKSYAGINQHSKAIQDYNAAIQISTVDPEAFNQRGVSYANLGEYQKSIDDFSEAIILNSYNPIYYLQRGWSYTDIREYQKALVDFEYSFNLSENEPNLWPAIYQAKGNVYFLLEDDQNSIAQYNKAIELRPNVSDFYYERGKVFSWIQSNQLALVDFNKAIELQPIYPEYFNVRGREYFLIGEDNLSLLDFNKSIDLDPTNAYSFYLRGVFYLYKNNYLQAISDFDQSIKIDPNVSLSYLSRGQAKNQNRDYSEAIDDFAKAIELDPKLNEAYHGKAVSYDLLGERLKAIEYFTAAINLSPDTAIRSYIGRAVSYEVMGKSNSALADYNKVLEIDPTNQTAKTAITYILNQESN